MKWVVGFEDPVSELCLNCVRCAVVHSGLGERFGRDTPTHCYRQYRGDRGKGVNRDHAISIRVVKKYY